MFSSSKKPYSAITVQVDRLTSEQVEEDDVSGIFDLVEVIRIQDSGPTEAARALRKKLKYGSPHRQIRALVILDGLIQNAGSKFQRTFADEPLLERLRLMAREDGVDPQVRQKCKVFFIQWANAYKGTPGLERIAGLYKELPKTQRPAAARQKVLREADQLGVDEQPAQSPFAETQTQFQSSSQAQTQAQPRAQPLSPSRPATLTSTSTSFSSKFFKDKKGPTGKAFSLSKEKDNMTNAIAQASIASTNLLNGVQLINREHEKLSENAEVVRRFEACKSLRRKILFYIQHVESDQWIGSLVNANDELVKALTAYEIMDRSISDDSDSDAWESNGAQNAMSSKDRTTSAQESLSGLSIAEEAPPVKPPRPASIPMPPVPSFKLPPEVTPDDEGDDEDPFGDANAVATPNERPGMTWKEV